MEIIHLPMVFSAASGFVLNLYYPHKEQGTCQESWNTCRASVVSEMTFLFSQWSPVKHTILIETGRLP